LGGWIVVLDGTGVAGNCTILQYNSGYATAWITKVHVRVKTKAKLPIINGTLGN
jgi:hypothetical protein